MAVALSLALAACGERSADQTVGQRVDSAIGRAGEVAREVEKGGREAAQDARSATLGGKQTTASLSGGNADEGTNDPQGKLRAQFPSDERGQKAYEAYLKRNPDAAAKA